MILNLTIALGRKSTIAILAWEMRDNDRLTLIFLLVYLQVK